jgi:hypothetical protein
VGFFSNIAGRVRQAWTKDKEQIPLQLAKGATMGGYPQSGYDLLSAYGYDVLGDYLRLEQDLLSRYIDYEEMDDYPEIAAAVDIFADDATQPDTSLNRTVWVTSPDQNVQQMLDDLFNRRLRIDEEIWEIARTLVKYGNDFEELLVTPQGVVGLNFLPPPTVRRIEGPRGELFGFIQDFQGRFGYSPEEFKHILAKRTSSMTGQALPGDRSLQGLDPSLAALEDWEVVHYRMRGKHRRSIYGFSTLEAARWIWKRLILLEDSALIYRLQRAPERFAFYVDVGDLPPAEALAYVNRVRQQYKKKKFVNPATGRLDQKFNPLGQDEDFFLPSRQGQDGTRIDVLAGPVWQHMEDIEYFQNKMFSAMKIPKAYLAQDDNTARAVLSTEDVRFARSVLRVQREIQNGLRKICRVHLAALGMDPHKIEYEVHMTVPSSIFELAQLEVRNARADLAGRMKEFVSIYWIYKNVFSMSDQEIEILTKQREEDVMDDTMWQAKAQSAAEKLAQPEGGEGGMQMSKSGKPKPSKIWTPNSPRTPLLRGGARGISDRELMAGGNRQSERRADEKLNKLLKNDHRLANSLRELQSLVTSLARSR